jgi:hypothetical protein
MKRVHCHRNEQGVAMVTAILVSAVILTLSITAASLSIHNTDSSGMDSRRLQVVAAAEAGLNATLSALPSTPTGSLPCSVTGSTSASPAQQYTATVTYYDAAGIQMACPPSSAPTRALVSSTALASQAVSPSAKRTMQTEVVMHPLTGGFGAAAIFSDQSPTTSNAVTINGQVGDDANVYTNGSWTCQNAMVVHGSMSAQGAISMQNSCQVTRDVWANGSVTLTNSILIGHNVTSSTSSIALQNSAHVLNSAVAGTTITLQNASAIDGTKTPNHPSPAPPTQSLPTVNFDATAWQAAGYTVLNQTCAQVAAVRTVTVKTVFRISPACALTWTNANTMNLSADTAIVTDGSIAMANATTWNSGDGLPHLLDFIVPTGATCTGGSPANFTTTNSTSFSSMLQVFVYTPCTATFNNSTAVSGQVYAGKVVVANAFSFNYKTSVVPGSGSISGYNVDIAYVREVVNP